jgi:hypothetical protein
MAVALAVAVFCSTPVSAQDLSGTRESRLAYETMIMRSTNAASAVALPAWNVPQGHSAFLDSSVFRRGATTRTVYDTSMAYARAHFAFPPILAPGLGLAVQDSVLPWIVVRVGQDTTSYAFAGTSGGVTDTIRVAIEWSDDGNNWFRMPGTPTHRFDTVFMTSGQDGLQSPTLFGVEIAPGQDRVEIPIKCRQSTYNGADFITNLTSCMAGNYLRFIIGGAYSGQYKLSIASWVKD